MAEIKALYRTTKQIIIYYEKAVSPRVKPEKTRK
jgi:hypothetical protein